MVGANYVIWEEYILVQPCEINYIPFASRVRINLVSLIFKQGSWTIILRLQPSS